MRKAPGGLAELAEHVRPVTLARDQRLPVAPALEPLLPNGLRRGAVYSVRARAGAPGGATSLALALAAEASAAGSWIAAVGVPSLGLVAAADLGVALERLVLVAPPAPAGWPEVVAALVDGFDIVILGGSRSGGGRGLRAADARRVAARARERGTVLVTLGDTAGEQPDVHLEVVSSSWDGLGDGHGHLRARRTTVAAGGRREASRGRQVELWLPAADGGIEPVIADPVPLRRRDPA